MAAIDPEKLGFKKFTRSRVVIDDEVVFVRATGIITFAPAVVEKHLKNVQWVNLYFRGRDNTIAVVPGNEKSGGFKLTAHGRRKSLSGGGFLVRHKLQGGKRPFRAIQVPVKLESGLITFKLSQ